jgi:hypothetical protein
MKLPSIIAGRNENARYWHVGEYFLTAYPALRGWDVRVRSRCWEPTELTLDGHFATESDACDWCARMAAVFAQDQADDGLASSGPVDS